MQSPLVLSCRDPWLVNTLIQGLRALTLLPLPGNFGNKSLARNVWQSQASLVPPPSCDSGNEPTLVEVEKEGEIRFMRLAPQHPSCSVLPDLLKLPVGSVLWLLLVYL